VPVVFLFIDSLSWNATMEVHIANSFFTGSSRAGTTLLVQAKRPWETQQSVRTTSWKENLAARGITVGREAESSPESKNYSPLP
jgi:hypothetical protein